MQRLPGHTLLALLLLVTTHGVRDAAAAAGRSSPSSPKPPRPSPSPKPPLPPITLPNATGKRKFNLRVNGLSREVYSYLPRNRSASPPLLLLFHGTGGSGDFWFDGDTDTQSLANAVGAVVLAPTSRWMPSGDWDHDGESGYWETWPNVNVSTNEDLQLVRTLIEAAGQAYNVDPRRVYALGHSNGAFFTLLVASSMADRVAAFASSSGGLVRCATTLSCTFSSASEPVEPDPDASPPAAPSCSALHTEPGWCSCQGAAKPVSIRSDGLMPPGYLAHGTADPMVSVQYTCELEARMRAVGASARTELRAGDGHVVPPDFVSAAWSYIGEFRRLPPAQPPSPRMPPPPSPSNGR